MIISSSSNEKIKEVRKLIKSSKEREERDLYVVEGIRMFREIPKDDIVDVFLSETMYQELKDDVCDINPNVVSDKIFSGISDTNSPQGILALVKRKHLDIEGLCKLQKENDEKPFLLIIERLQDPGNMGTIIRSAEGAGVTGIIISGDSVDIYNPKTVRSTMGSIFRVPLCISEDLKQDINMIKKMGIKLYGAHLDGEFFYNKDFTEPCAFLIGNEGKGLSEEISHLSDELIKIPMKGKVESLNAACSATIIGYEVLRQRIIM